MLHNCQVCNVQPKIRLFVSVLFKTLYNYCLSLQWIIGELKRCDISFELVDFLKNLVTQLITMQPTASSSPSSSSTSSSSSSSSATTILHDLVHLDRPQDALRHQKVVRPRCTECEKVKVCSMCAKCKVGLCIQKSSSKDNAQNCWEIQYIKILEIWLFVILVLCYRILW